MTISRKLLCAVYALMALLALVGTWGNNVHYLTLGVLGANARFWADTLAHPASRSITVDIFFLTYAATSWMLLEARRLATKRAWLYVLFGALIAISVTFPAFLIHRERALAARGDGVEAGRLSTADALGLAAMGLVVLAYGIVALSR